MITRRSLLTMLGIAPFLSPFWRKMKKTSEVASLRSVNEIKTVEVLPGEFIRYIQSYWEGTIIYNNGEKKTIYLQPDEVIPWCVENVFDNPRIYSYHFDRKYPSDVNV